MFIFLISLTFFYLSAQWLSHVGVPRIVVVTFDILNRQ